MRAALRTVLCAAALAALPPSAFAQKIFDQRINHWHVVGGSNCFAFNRPYRELSATPFNALTIILTKDGRWSFSVYFWPNALKDDADTPLVFTFGERKDVKAHGKAFGGMAVLLANAGASFRDDFAKAENGALVVRAEGVKYGLHFDISDIAAVFAALEDCAKTLR